MRWFGVDLLDLGSPRLSWRRLGVLIRSLPRESLCVRAEAGEKARWGESEHLLADIADLIQHQVWQFAQAHSKRTVKRPKPIRRPGVNPTADGRRFGNARMTIDEARKYLAKFRGG